MFRSDNSSVCFLQKKNLDSQKSQSRNANESLSVHFAEDKEVNKSTADHRVAQTPVDQFGSIQASIIPVATTRESSQLDLYSRFKQNAS